MSWQSGPCVPGDAEPMTDDEVADLVARAELAAVRASRSGRSEQDARCDVVGGMDGGDAGDLDAFGGSR